MMEVPLTVGSLIEHHKRYHAGTEIISLETIGRQTTGGQTTVFTFS
jgi:hypothetical protein